MRRKKRIRPIMFVGTSSDVGKSVLNTAFCRIFLQDGYTPAPFKAQNMSLNSYATPEGFEIGRAQAVQAEACRIPCRVEMNPVLLKPNKGYTAQMVLHGVPIINEQELEYWNRPTRTELFMEVCHSFDKLNSEFNPVVLEGAGSISELNLRVNDIVNMRMAHYADAATYLVVDIDKGGVYASAFGTIKLLLPEHLPLVKGIIINKFRGKIELLDNMRSELESLCGVPVVGVVPYMENLLIEQEDGVALENIHAVSKKDAVKIGVVLLRHISNFTDFNAIELHPSFQLSYVTHPNEIEDIDVLIIPGSKNTISDMLNLRSTGMAKAILMHFKKDKPLYGICGGFQMMGEWINDPLHIEGEIESIPGLGIFPVSTILEGEKITRQCNFRTYHGDVVGVGYEIHMGRTASEHPFAILDDGSSEGYYLTDKCWGSYLHGVFDNTSIIKSLLGTVGGESKALVDYQQLKEDNYDKLADWVRRHVDMDKIYDALTI